MCVQEEVVQLERVCGSDYGITVEALGRPMVVLKQALLHAVVLCIRMLVPHPVRFLSFFFFAVFLLHARTWLVASSNGTAHLF